MDSHQQFNAQQALSMLGGYAYHHICGFRPVRCEVFAPALCKGCSSILMQVKYIAVNGFVDDRRPPFTLWPFQPCVRQTLLRSWR